VIFLTATVDEARRSGRPSSVCRSTTLIEFGIAHDGDADRIMTVDKTGRFVPRGVLMTLFAHRTVRWEGAVVVPSTVGCVGVVRFIQTLKDQLNSSNLYKNTPVGAL